MKFFLPLILLALLFFKRASGQTGKLDVKSIHQFGIVGNGVVDNFYKVPDGFGKEVGFGWSTGLYYLAGVEKFCFMSELLIAKRNFSFNQNFGDPTTTYTSKDELDFTNLLLAIHFLVTPPLRSNLRLLAGGGPYIGYGLSARRKQAETLTSAGSTQSAYTEANMGFGENGAQRIEVGVQAKLGLIIKSKVLLNVGYAINARRIFTESEDFRTHMLYVGVGYNFLNNK